MSSNIAAGGVVPIINVLDYLTPEINRPDLFQQKGYPIQGGGGGSTRYILKASGGDTQPTQSIQRHTASGQERSPFISLYYTFGLIVVSAAIFLTLAAWSNVLLSWYDSMFISPTLDSVTKSRLFFAITISIIAIIVIIVLVAFWYYYTIHHGL